MKKKNLVIGGLCTVMAACFVTACATGLDPYDESKFGGSTNNESNELVTDKKIKLDGKLDEDCWQNQKEFDFTYQNVRVRVKTVFGDLGFYVGYEVEDDHVYAVEGRDVWMGSSVEMYVDRGDATKKSERTFQYRLGALDQWELLYGYETKEDSWSATYLPIVGKTQVLGTVNSGSTQGMTAEIYVRWDALGYDFTSENFVIPETVKIMPVYNQSSGVEMDSARDFWVNNGGDIGNPMHYWLFDENGFADADEEGAVVGDSVYGRVKTTGWDITGESDGIIRSKTAGDQSIFFKDIYATDYAVTTFIEYRDALEYWANNLYWQKDPYPKAGLILASDTTIQAYLLNYDSEHRYGTAEGMFFRKGNPDPRSTWELYDPQNLNSLMVDAANGKLRMTGVKVGRYLLVFIGDGSTEKYGGTFVGMQEISETAGQAAPGFYTLGCEVEFTDYAVTTDSGIITGLANSVLSVLRLDQKSGGALSVNQLGYKIGETATVTVNTYENYKLVSLKVNGVEKIDSLSEDGELTLIMTENEVTVTPEFERVNDARVAEGTLRYIEKNAPSGNIEMLIAGTAKDGGKVFLQLKPDAANAGGIAEWYANLPDGTYTAHILVDSIYRANKVFTVDGVNTEISVIDTPLNWVFGGSVETYKDGSVIVRGFNQYREVSNRSATNYFAITAYHFRDDNNFTTVGTWETGGFGVKIDNVIYRFHAMKADSNEIYLYIEVDGGASQEYRGIYHSVSGTGAPLTMDMYYLNGEFRFVFDGTTAFVVNSENTPNEALQVLFNTSKTKYLGLITVGKDMVFQDYDFAFNEEETMAMYGGSNEATYTVTGTFSYANGLYSAGDTVTVTSRRYSGTVSGDSWSIDLPDGTHEVTFTSSRFRSVTLLVDVNGGNVAVNEKIQFKQIKFDDMSVVVCEDEVNNNFDIMGGDWTATFFAGVTAGTGIRVDASVHRLDGKSLQYGDWQTGGLFIGTESNTFIVFVKSMENSSSIMIGETQNAWGNWWWYDIPYSFGGTGDNLDLTFVYLPGSLTLMLGGKVVVSITPDTVGTGEGRGACTLTAYNSLFNGLLSNDISAHKVGLRIAHSPSTNTGVSFKNVGYAPVNAIPSEMYGTVKLPSPLADGLKITVEDNKLSGFIGETVILDFVLDEGKTITTLTVGGKNVLSELSGGKLTITLTSGEQELVAVTEGVSVFAVTGTLGYAAGLYSAGDKVTVSSATFVGTLSGENWTIKLPDGTHEITFESERYVSQTVNVTVNGGAASVSTKVEFRQIKFTDDSQYERDGNDVITPAVGNWDNTAYFAGINARDGIRIDAHMQRTDGNNFVNSTWETGGFTFAINNTKFYLFFKMESGAVVVTLGDNVSWTWRESCTVYPRNVTGTGASVDMSVVFIDSKIYLLIANDAVGFYDVSDTVLATGSGSVKAGFFTTANTTVPMRFSNFGYRAVTELPEDFKLNRPQATIFADNNGTVVYDDGSIGIASTTYWLKDPTGAGQFLTSDAQGDFIINYTLKRMDGFFEQEGTWNTPYFQIYIGGVEYSFFAMRENASTTVFYLNSATQNLEFRVPYTYQGTGAPLTISVGYSSNDHLLHIRLAGTHYTFEVTNAAGSSYETLYAENAKILGFRCGVFAGVVSDISYSVTKAEVDAKLQEWGTATNVGATA